MPQPLTLTSLPLFPLAAVLLPGGHLALRVFEVRYLDMVRKCQQAGAPFGVVCLRSGSEVRKAGAPQEQLHAVGTLARITQLQSPQPALIHLECEGTQRFHIQRSLVDECAHSSGLAKRQYESTMQAVQTAQESAWRISTHVSVLKSGVTACRSSTRVSPRPRNALC